MVPTHVPRFQEALSLRLSSSYLMREFFCCFQVSSNAMFELQLNNFHNHNGYNSEGHCCSGYRDTYGRCSEKCLTKFRVCLKVYQEVIDYHNPCTFGEITTPILGENEIDFAKVHKDGFLNPVQITLDAWQVRIVESHHKYV